MRIDHGRLIRDPFFARFGKGRPAESGNEMNQLNIRANPRANPIVARCGGLCGFALLFDTERKPVFE